MNFKISSWLSNGRRDNDQKGMTKYLNSLHNGGFDSSELLAPRTETYPSKFYISVTLHSLENLIKLTDILGTVILDGRDITIYDDYIE